MVLWAKSKGLIDIKGSINVYDLNEALIGTYLNIKITIFILFTLFVFSAILAQESALGW